MKSVYKKAASILIFTGSIIMANSQNLDSLPQEQRDSLLISTAKEVVLRYGPGYYREYKQPLIKREEIPPKGALNPTGEDAGKIFYRVTFLYDNTKEQLPYDNDRAAVVSFLGNTGEPVGVMFGNGWGKLIPENGWRNDAVTEQIQYERIPIFPIYDKEHPEKKEPINLDELKREGYEEEGDGQWVKTTRDVPPNVDLLKRKGYEERADGQWVRVKKQETLNRKK